MEVNIKQALKVFFSKSSFEMIYFEAFANALDAGATDFYIDIKQGNELKELSLVLTDNGIGFTDERFRKFGKLFDVEEEPSHKGLGRLVYLCYFGKVHVESCFNNSVRRVFDFDESFKGISQTIHTGNEDNGTVLTMTEFLGTKLGRNDYIKPSYIKNALLENFYMKFYKAKLVGRQLNIFIRLFVDGQIVSEETITTDSMPSFSVKELTTQMDFFNSIHDSDHPYDRKVIYPPLINVFYMIIGRIFDFKMFSTLEIRDSRLGIMMQMLYHGILFIALYNRLISMRQNICNNVRENRIIYTIMLFSLPMLFTIERGNSVFLCLLSLLYFVEYYKSDKKSNRYKSYIALAIAGSIKIIPFIFGALLFRTVRKKEIIHAGLICSVVFMAPFIVTHGGPIQMVKNIMFTTNLFQSGEVRDGIFKFMGYGAFVNISNIYQFIDRIFEVDISGIGAVINKVLLGITLLICSISTKITEFYKVTLLSLILLLFVGISAIYNLIYLFIPLILLINEYDYGKTSNINYSILFTFLGIIMTPIFNPPLDILSTFSEDIHPLTISTIVECLFVVMLYFYMLIKSILIIKNSI